MKMKKLLSVAEAADLLNVTAWTLRKWDRDGKLVALRTDGGHRRYRQSDINQFLGITVPESEREEATAVYSRVSSHDQKQKGDLDRQKARNLEHCVKQNYRVTHIFDEVGSGMNDNRPKLHKLFKLVTDHKVTRVVVEHKDRLARFNFSIFETFFNSHGVVVEVIEDKAGKSYEQELVDDIISIMASFSAKMYGKRSASRRKKKQQLNVV